MEINVFSQKTVHYSKTLEYCLSINNIDYILMSHESSKTGIEYWFNGIHVSLMDEVLPNITLATLLTYIN